MQDRTVASLSAPLRAILVVGVAVYYVSKLQMTITSTLHFPNYVLAILPVWYVSYLIHDVLTHLEVLVVFSYTVLHQNVIPS